MSTYHTGQPSPAPGVRSASKLGNCLAAPASQRRPCSAGPAAPAPQPEPVRIRRRVRVGPAVFRLAGAGAGAGALGGRRGAAGGGGGARRVVDFFAKSNAKPDQYTCRVRQLCPNAAIYVLTSTSTSNRV